MDRKEVARETLKIMEQGYYEYEGKTVIFSEQMRRSIEESLLITPEQGASLLKKYERSGVISESSVKNGICVENISTVDAILKLSKEGKEKIGVLNFASAKNPGGGFLNGAMAQEESLAASSTLYQTLLANPQYYQSNRAQSSMMYTDYAIYSPNVAFFRDGCFRLISEPCYASVLTLPAVNLGQVLQKGEDVNTAHQKMRRRMKLALTIFAEQGAKNLVLGAYGCGVFRNDPVQIAAWWNELLTEEMGGYFDFVFHAVLDHSKNENCIKAFEAIKI